MSAGVSNAGRGLYTPEVLAAAMELAAFPWRDDLPYTGTARSRSCGSTLDLALETDATGAITALGLRPHACAIGQAAAAQFVRGAKGQTRAAIAQARASLALWLAGDGAQPDWPGLALLDPARAYPARHGAILLAWDAALAALPTD
ncbi:iron-sulfur cluster assembly scaffold protein [Novosphingobium sp. 28-62-57]|uniref:iron-sulfur cluster assembly scaffold protein n=1 Tax=Novosphingobium sp. 28-62-57 TaxID=1970409 RepID=UPI0025F91B50|nr:iron-sulfur cluster assembly scaffold protein [Novosphingobium sp. 28-62-57]